MNKPLKYIPQLPISNKDTKFVALLKSIPHHQTGMLGCIIVIIGLISSRVLMSLGMILLIANAVFNINVVNNFKAFFKHRAFFALSLLFFLYLFSGLISEDIPNWWEKVVDKLPFISIPIAFTAFTRFNKQDYYTLLSIFLWVIGISAAMLLVEYIQNYNHYTIQYEKGQVLPTPTNHVRYSLMLAYSIVIALVLWYENFSIKFKWEKYLSLFLAVFLFVFIHILAVRSGLLALYLCISGLLIYYTLKNGRVFLLIGALVVLWGVGSLATHYVPSLKNKIGYTKWTLMVLDHGKPKDFAKYSDSKRLFSILTSIELGNQHPIFGVGVSDINTEMEKLYEKNHPHLKGLALSTHNQFAYTYAATGVIGVLVFLYSLLRPVFWRKNYQMVLLSSFYIILFSSFMVECTIERQTGIAFCVLFWVMGLRYWELKEA